MDIFQIMGPIMVGPSSSHTAGAVKIGYLAAKLLGEPPVEANICLYGSFAATGPGHGTDRALIGGLLGMRPDDLRIPESFQVADRAGLRFQFEKKTAGSSMHPNSVTMGITGQYGQKLSMQAFSAGGGRIVVEKLDGMDTGFGGEKPTLIIRHTDRPGSVAYAAEHLTRRGINIASVRLSRRSRGGEAVLVIETDDPVSADTLRKLHRMEGVLGVIYYEGD